MDGGALELIFHKAQKALDNRFLNPILRLATSVFNKENPSLVIFSYLQTTFNVSQEPLPPPNPCAKTGSYMHVKYYKLIS